MSDLYKKIMNAQPSSSGSVDYWELVRNTNPKLYDEIASIAQGTAMEGNVGFIGTMTACITTVLIGHALGPLSGVTKKTAIAIDAAVSIVKGSGSQAASEIVNVGHGADYTVETFVKDVLNVIFSVGAEIGIGFLGLSLGPELLAIVAANVAIQEWLDNKCESYMAMS